MVPEQTTQQDPVGRESSAQASFDVALMAVSHLLSEAELCVQRGRTARADHLFRLAELCAMRSRYVELVRLVWSYGNREDSPRPSG
jgi:hypothetical protein